MFRPQDLHARLRQTPFRPFRILASENLSYEIRHPDLMMVGERDVTIGFASSISPNIYNRQIRIALIHIVGMEEVQEAPSGISTNGQG